MARANSAKNKQRMSPSRTEASQGDSLSAAATPSPVSPPAKNPSLLTTSVVLFSLWFVYLLVVALRG